MWLRAWVGWLLALLLAATLGVVDHLDTLRLDAMATGELRQDLSIRETAIFQAEASLAAVLQNPASSDTAPSLRQAAVLLNVASASIGFGYLHDKPVIASLQKLNWAEYQASWALEALAQKSEGAPLPPADITQIRDLDQALLGFSAQAPRLSVHPSSHHARGGFTSAAADLTRSLEQFAARTHA